MDGVWRVCVDTLPHTHSCVCGRVSEGVSCLVSEWWPVGGMCEWLEQWVGEVSMGRECGMACVGVGMSGVCVCTCGCMYVRKGEMRG